MSLYCFTSWVDVYFAKIISVKCRGTFICLSHEASTWQEWLPASLQWRHNGRDGVSNHKPDVVYSTVYWSVYQRKHLSPASLAFVRGIHRWPVNSPHKGPVTRKMVSMLTVYKKNRSNFETIRQLPRIDRFGILRLYHIELSTNVDHAFNLITSKYPTHSNTGKITVAESSCTH